MRNLLIISFGMVLACFVFVSAAYSLTVDVTNNTDVDIYYLYVSPSSSGDWEEDVLGDEILEAGTTVTVTLSGYDECYWDFLAVFDDEDEVTLTEVNICDSDVVFGYETENYESTSSETSTELYVDVTNNTNVDIHYLYVSPNSSGDWEEDVLGDQILEAGTTVTVTLTGYDECYWDFLAVFADEDEVTLMDINICESDVVFGYE